MNHTPQEMRREQTRNQLLEAALATFTKKGYYATTSKDIAKVACVSIGSFYKYFPDKKNILLEILNNFLDESFVNHITSNNVNSNKTLDIQSLIKQLVNSHNFSEDFYHQVTLLSKIDPDIKEVYSIYQRKIDNYIIQYLEILNIKKSHEEMEIIATLLYSLIESAIHMIKFQKLDESKVYSEIFNLLEIYLLNMKR